MIQKNNRKAMQQVIKQLQQWVDGEVPFTTVLGSNHLIDVNKVLQQISTADLVQELSERSDVAYVDADANTTIAIKFFTKHTKDYIVVKNLKGKEVPNHFEVAKAEEHIIGGEQWLTQTTQGCTCETCKTIAIREGWL